MNEIYNGGFAPEFSVSISKETIVLVQGYLKFYRLSLRHLKFCYFSIFTNLLRTEKKYEEI